MKWRNLLLDYFKFDASPSVWNKFISEIPESTFFHQYEWLNVIHETYGFPIHRLVIKKDGELLGVIGLCISKGLFGTRIVSIPFSDYGGLCIKKEAVKYSVEIISEINLMANNLGARYILMKSSPVIANKYFLKSGFKNITDHYAFIVKLDKTFEKIYNSFDKNTRYDIRRAENRYKLLIKETNIDNFIPSFYELYLKNVKRLGSPPHHIKYFENMLDKFRNSIKVFFCEYNDKEIGGLLLLTYRKTVHAYTIGYTSQGRKWGASYLLHRDAIKWSSENNYNYYDIGPAKKNSGAYMHKKGFVTNPILKNIIVKDYSGKGYLTPENWKYKLFSNFLRKCPEYLFKKIGLPIKKQLE